MRRDIRNLILLLNTTFIMDGEIDIHCKCGITAN